jgi:hypothetical protein
MVAPRLLAFLDGFHDRRVDLERVNLSYVILIPKTPGATIVGAHRPVCHQNCDVKIASKILTTRLQRQLPSLINDPDWLPAGEKHI